uniref:Carrier domain-containing protein n=1 Tax=Kalanchoe fedtschenkoi TaxID=63787 RepID=A0A7N0SVJ1_KALFE
MWRSIDMQLGAVCDSWFEVDFEAMARHAVDRSCGQLVDISVAQFPTDGFIHYIAHSSRQIRRLQIVSCHALSEDVLKETASKFPMLEELKVQSTQFSVAAVEAIGRCCPQLKTFKCNVFGYVPLQAQDDDLADMIAKTMPQLCHLQLLKTKITNTGLKVILDGCPCLETLDLRGCYLVNPKVDNIVEDCSARFMKVRFPAEPIELGEYQGAEPGDNWYSDGSFDDHSLDSSGHFDPSDFDDPFYDDDGVDYDDLFSNWDDEEEYPLGDEEQEDILGMEEEEKEEAGAEQDDLFGNVEDEEEDPVGEEEQEAILGIEEVEEKEEEAVAEQEIEEEDGFEIDEEENLNDGGDD